MVRINSRFPRAAMACAALLVVAGAAHGQRVRGAPGTGGPPDAGVKAGIHIAQGQRVNFNYNMTDGAGFLWDIQYYGTVGQGTNYCYSGGLYCQISGNSIHSNNNGWTNKDGDEVELGPYNHGNLKIYRRIKVYKDQGLARWLDIFDNTGTTDTTVQVQIQTNTNWAVTRTTGSGGKAGFGDKDWAFITESPSGGGPNPPVLMHIVCDKKSKLRPAVQVQGNQIYVRYNITVKAGQTAILCYFESQGNSLDGHLKTLKSFAPYKALKDLPAAARKLILNFSTTTATYEEFNLERSEQSDIVYQASGDPIYGTVANTSFTLQTASIGELRLKAEDVIGMVASPSEAGTFRVLLKDGEMVRGAVPASDKLSLKREGGDLEIPFERVSQWSFRISDARPYDIPFPGPTLVLRTGDRLAFNPASVALSFQTRHGAIPLKADDLQVIRMDNPGNAVHRAFFLNGSSMAGFLTPEKLSASTKLAPKVDITRDLISQIEFSPEERPNPLLARAVLTNQDELLGELADEKIRIVTDYGTVEVKPQNIRSLAFSPDRQGRMAAMLWDGTVLRGQLGQDELAFEITPGPTVKIAAGQCVSVIRSQMLPPAETIKKVDQLVGQLGAEAVNDRKRAADDLAEMGETIVPLLQKHLNSRDPEVRKTIQEVIDRIGGKKAPTAPPMPVMIEGMMMRRGG
ncbi:MAG: HEAT repeat domain-containing protein [Phycisphaerae bacterium]